MPFWVGLSTHVSWLDCVTCTSIENAWSQRSDHYHWQSAEGGRVLPEGLKNCRCTNGSSRIARVQEKMQIRVIFCEPRSLPQTLHFSRPVKRSRSIFTRPIPMLLRLIFQQHSTANRKKRSSSSSVRTGTSLHGNLRTCRVYLGDWLSIVCESTRK